MKPSWKVITPGQLALFSLLPFALAEPELRAIYEPACDDTLRGVVDDCQAAINAIWAMRGGVPTTPGCVDVFESGKCVIELCDMQGEGSSVDYMGIAPAAQTVLAYCYDNGNSAGTTKIEGFQQSGQGHSSAEVRIRAPMAGGPPDVPTRRDFADRKRRAVEARQPDFDVAPRNEDRRREYADRNHEATSPYVESEFGLFREGEAQFGFTYLILPQTQNLIRDTFVNEWNRRRSWWTQASRRTVGVEVVDGDLRYNIAIVGRGGTHVTDVPIIDRGGLVDAFFRLHAADGNPRVFTGYVHLMGGNFVGLMEITINPVIAQPIPSRQILFGGGSNPVKV